MAAQAALTRNVKTYLDFTHKSQADLAAKLGISQGYVSLLLSGKRTWQMGMLDSLADFFCVTVAALFVEGEHGGERRSGVERRVRGERRRTQRASAPTSPSTDANDRGESSKILPFKKSPKPRPSPKQIGLSIKVDVRQPHRDPAPPKGA